MTIETRLLDLWSRPPDDRPDAVAAFRAVYADPVPINGSARPVADLVERARALHTAFTEHRVEVVDRVEAPGRPAIAFRHTVLRDGRRGRRERELQPGTRRGRGRDPERRRTGGTAARGLSCRTR
jgi:hypothetical protein